MTIIFGGGIGRSGLGGQAWANLQYLIGLRELGHEVFYLEDCGESSWAYNWELGDGTFDLAYPASYVREHVEPFGFKGRWIYRAGAESAGMPLADFQAVCAAADLFIMRAIPIWNWRKEYDGPRRRVFIDVDPGFTQMLIAGGDRGLSEAIQRCDRLFTIGQRFSAPDCSCLTNGWEWLKTLPPVSLSAWPWVEGGAATHFTSVMRWSAVHEDKPEDQAYGQKDQEFARFIDLPRRTSQRFLIALIGPESLVDHGWEIVPGEKATRTPQAYRQFIQQSRAEFGIAKHGYVKTRGGWFSDRSVCYLASGLPVLVQDTGLTDWLSVGEGVVTFQDPSDVLRGIETINSDYEHHRRAARELAEECFSTERVLPAFLDAAMS